MKSLTTKDARCYQVEPLCRLVGVTKQAYYKYNDSTQMMKLTQEQFALAFILEVRKRDPGIGGKKLWLMYQREMGGMGRDRFEGILDRYHLKVRNRIRKPRTTESRHGLPIYPNLTYNLIPTRPNQIWVSDITYIPIWGRPTEYEFCYLSLILDAYTAEIVGWSLGKTLETKYPIEALKMALPRLEGQKVDLIHHSDRGCQYASAVYTSLLRKHGISISMTESGNPKQNAQAERINNTIKNEFFKGVRFRNMVQLRRALTQAVAFYNTQRPHMSLDMMTPEQAASHRGEINKRWHSYRTMAIRRSLEELRQDQQTDLVSPIPLRGLLPAYGLQSTPQRDKKQLE